MNKMVNCIKLIWVTITDSRPIRAYEIMYIDQFNLNKNDIKIDNYENLISLLKDRYKSLIKNDRDKLFIEKVKIQDRLERLTSINMTSSILSFFAMFISILLFVSGLSQDQSERFSMGNLVLDIVSVVFIFALALKLYDTSNIRNYRGYNIICLEIINQLEIETSEKEPENKINDSEMDFNIRDISKAALNSKFILLIGSIILLVLLSLMWLWSGISGFKFDEYYSKKVEITFSFLGTILGGLATLIAVFMTINHTNKIQKENNENIYIEREIEKCKLEIEYLKKLYKISYRYEKFMENLEEILIAFINDEKKNSLKRLFKKSNIPVISKNIMEENGDYIRNIEIEASCIQIKDISEKVKLLLEFQEYFLDLFGEITLNIEKYKEEDIKSIFDIEKNETVFAIMISLLKSLNIAISRNIKLNKNKININSKQ